MTELGFYTEFESAKEINNYARTSKKSLTVTIS